MWIKYSRCGISTATDVLNSLSSDWCGECCYSLETKVQVGPGVPAFDWPVAGCTSGSWLLPQDTPQELQRSQTGKSRAGQVVIIVFTCPCFVKYLSQMSPKCVPTQFLPHTLSKGCSLAFLPSQINDIFKCLHMWLHPRGGLDGKDNWKLH